MLSNLFPRMFEGFFYSAELGETIDTICNKFEVSINEVTLMNNLVYPYKIYEGDILFIAKNNDPYIANISESNNSKNDFSLKSVITKKYPIMKRKDTGKYVVILKRLISVLGYKFSSVNSVFDGELENYILDIQRKAGLTQNGIVEAKVWEYIFNSVNCGEI